MGGRGSAMGRVTSGGTFTGNATSMANIRNELSVGMNMKVSSLTDTQVELVYQAVKEYNELDPMFADTIKATGITIYEKQLNTTILAQARPGLMELNTRYFGGDAQAAHQAMQRSEASGWHPPGDASSIIAHELGHYMHLGARAAVRHLVSRGVQDKLVNELAKNPTFSSNNVQNKIVAKVAKRAGVGIKELRGRISEYANYNSSEATAEAFADVVHNKGNAKKASKLIVQEYTRVYNHLNELIRNNP